MVVRHMKRSFSVSSLHIKFPTQAFLWGSVSRLNVAISYSPTGYCLSHCPPLYSLPRSWSFHQLPSGRYTSRCLALAYRTGATSRWSPRMNSQSMNWAIGSSAAIHQRGRAIGVPENNLETTFVSIEVKRCHFLHIIKEAMPIEHRCEIIGAWTTSGLVYNCIRPAREF